MVLSRTPTPHPLLMAKLKKAATQGERERAEALARVYDSAKSEDDDASDSCCSTPREENFPHDTSPERSAALPAASGDDSGPSTPLPAKRAARFAVPASGSALGSPHPCPAVHVTWWDQAGGGSAPDTATLAAMAAEAAAALRRLAAAAAAAAAETGASGGFAVRRRT